LSPEHVFDAGEFCGDFAAVHESGIDAVDGSSTGT